MPQTPCEPDEQINIPDVLAEVIRMVDLYETALVTNDVNSLDAMFWSSPHTVRYGATECLYGHDEILAFRYRRNPKGLMRTVTRRVITTFGRDAATANLEFCREGHDRVGRQSQCWIRRPEGWRIVSAHVSWMDVPDAT